MHWQVSKKTSKSGCENWMQEEYFLKIWLAFVSPFSVCRISAKLLWWQHQSNGIQNNNIPSSSCNNQLFYISDPSPIKLCNQGNWQRGWPNMELRFVHGAPALPDELPGNVFCFCVSLSSIMYIKEAGAFRVHLFYVT